ncbi:MAG: LTA synthase family protein [Planctomycetes bacterium]|nr:LTA synthase family protein [Planctomycetota bacterium]
MEPNVDSDPRRSWRFVARPAWIVLAHLAVYAAARVVLYLAWPGDFGELGLAGLRRAAVAGLRFDLSIVAIGLAPAIVALSLPWRFAASARWRDAWAWWGFASLLLGTALLIGDGCYVGLVHRHIGVELAALDEDLDLLIGMAVGEYLPAVLGIGAFGVVAFFLWRTLMRWDARRFGRALSPVWSPLVVALALLVAIRGNVSGKPIGVVDAFESGSVAEGYLTLNGPFSVWHSSRNARPKAVEYMPWKDAVASVRGAVLAPNEKAGDEELPIQRARAPRSGPRPNVMVVLLESWDALAVDAIRGRRGLPPLGLTPRFDALAKEGVLYPRFHAAGQRSMDGFSAVLCGFPTLPGMPYIGRGMEQSRLGFLGELFAREGWSTFFLQGSKRRSFRGNAIAALAGFDVYEGMEDVVEHQGKEPMADWGAWDDDAFAETARLARGAKSPFLGFVFTTSTHPPFQVPTAEFERFAPDEQLHRYWNSIAYADWSLGRFFDGAKRDGWFANTVFVLVADHTSGLSASDGTPASLHHIPCLVIAPGLAPAIDERITSQLDVLPTLVDLAGIARPYAAFGRSLLEPGERGAWCIRGNLVLRVEESGWVLHNTKARLEAKASTAATDLDAIERRLLAFVQVATLALRRNQVYRPEAAMAPSVPVSTMPVR